MTSSKYEWDRAWSPSQTISVDFLGFPSNYTDFRERTKLPTLEQLTSWPCLILLGDPGMGKSTALEQVNHADSSDIVRKYQLKKFSQGSELIRAVEEDAEFNSWLASEQKMYLYLDGFDEALLRIPTIEHTITDWLDANKRKFRLNPVEVKIEGKATSFVGPGPTLCLRITCRSATKYTSLKRSLENLFGKENVSVFEILPLSQEHVRIAAQTEGVDANDFVNSITSTETVSFAAEPITLKFLIGLYKKGGLSTTEASKADFFLQGCRELSNEINSDYASHVKLTGMQRLRIASRVAVYLLLTNKSGVWHGSESPDSINNDLTLDDIVGDTFTVDHISETITLAKLLETLNTGLFTHIGENRIGFKHKAFSEFLAGWHLNEIKASTSTIQQFLTSPYDELKAVQHTHEVVSWLSLMNTDVFDLFVGHEPWLVLRSRRRFNNKQKERITASLLTLANKFDIVDDYDWRRFFSELSHPGISKQLKPFITNRHKSPVARRIAIIIAGKCKVNSLTQQLMNVLTSTTEHKYLRKEAIIALGSIENPQTLTTIRSFGLEQHIDDVDDELKGAALRILYPEKLSTCEVLTALNRVKKDNLYGAYRGFIDQLSISIPDNDLEKSLEFVLNDQDKFLDRDRNRDFEKFINKLISRCWSVQLTAVGIQKIALLFLALRSKFIGFPVENESPFRRPILLAMLPHLSRPSDVFHILGTAGTGSSALILEEDWPWLIEQAHTTNSDTRLKIGKILWMMLKYDSARSINEFLELVFAFDELKTDHAHAISPIEIDSEEAANRRKMIGLSSKANRETNESKKKSLDFSPVEKAIEFLNKFSYQHLDSWWRLIYMMGIDPEKGNFQTSHDFEFDIMKLPLWTHLELQQDSIICTAKEYLNAFNPKTSWIYTNRYDRQELAGYKAMLLIYRKNVKFFDKLPASFWTAWSATVIYCTFNSLNELPDDRAYILKLCRDSTQKPAQFYTHLEKYLLHQLKKTKSLFDLFKIKVLAGEGLFDLLLKILKNPICDEQNQGYIFDFLFEHKSEKARKYCYSLFLKLTRDRVALDQLDFATLAASRLLINPTGLKWESFWKILAGSKTAIRIFMKASPSLGFGSSRQIGHLTVRQKGDILLWIATNLSAPEDSSRGFLYSQSGVDNLIDYKGQLVRSLIEEGTLDAVIVLQRASRTLPDDDNFRWWLVSARESMRAKTWSPPTSSELRAGLINNQNKLVRSDEELLLAVEESLSRFQRKLQGKNPTAFFLWNQSKSMFGHKDENTLSDFIKMHLDYDLIERKLIVNREVEIKRSTGKSDGARTDIYIEVTNPNNDERYSLVIEVKGSWHSEIDTAMEHQLKNKYLSKHKSRIGLYLIGWFFCPLFTQRHKHKSLSKLTTALKVQSKLLTEPDKKLSTLILNCTIR